jgi:hypothetical protein
MSPPNQWLVRPRACGPRRTAFTFGHPTCKSLLKDMKASYEEAPVQED